jgi:hypothetical protein
MSAKGGFDDGILSSQQKRIIIAFIIAEQQTTSNVFSSQSEYQTLKKCSNCANEGYPTYTLVFGKSPPERIGLNREV